MEHALGELDRELEMQPTPVEIPCDENGRPEPGHGAPAGDAG
jgi:hypothetical protein